MSKFTKLKVGQVYNGFKVISIDELAPFNSDGILFIHEKTGMQVFHLLNADEENLFSFGFRTPCENSMGVAHIMEHSVLCGSKNYPLKDPFKTLANQSVKTFLNAMTFPDKTVYPASSVVEQDYFNLMAVYADAVFFPLLTEQTFLQEGHRYEVNSKGELELQGVVFNEMKGAYSSIESVIEEEIKRGLMPKSSYQYDSGGDPLEIPDLTYEEFIEFHKKHYIPSNCFLFLYGNIESEKQLDFINEKVLREFSGECASHGADDHSNGADDCAHADDNTRTALQEQFDRMTFCENFTQPKEKVVFAPLQTSAGGKSENKDSVILSWNLGEVTNSDLYMKAFLLSEILMGHDGSPFSKALLDCKLGEDLSPNSGLDSDMRYILLSCGLRGVKEGNVKKVEKVIFDVLEDIAKNGIQKSDLESALMSCEIYFREIVRNYGPYSLVLMRRAYKTWMNGKHPVQGIMTYSAFEKIKKEIETNPNYISQLVKEILLENKNRLFLVVKSDKNYNQRSETDLKNRVKLLKKGFSNSEWKAFIEETKSEQEKLHLLQLRQDTDSEAALVPHIKPQDLKAPENDSELVREKINEIDVFSCEQSVNGIVYFQAMFPIDVLNANYYPYIPYFSTCLTNVGFLGKNWAQTAGLVSSVSGGLTASPYTTSISPWLLEKIGESDASSTETQRKLYEYDICVGRNLLAIKMKFLEENLKDALDLFFNFLTTVNFSDSERLLELAQEYRNDMVSSISSCGHEYAMARSSCKASRTKAIDEIFNGLSAVFTSDEIAKMAKSDSKKLQEILENIKKTIFSSGFFFNIVAEKSGIEKTKEFLKNRLANLAENSSKNDVNVIKIQEAKYIPVDEIYALTEIQGKSEDFEVYLAETQVGYVAKSFPCSKTGTKESVIEGMYAHYLSNNILWDKIRTVCGSYGVYAIPSSMEGVFTLLTYRDPNPFRSNELFDEILRSTQDFNISDEDFERLIAGCFSKELQPKAPSAKGFLEFVRFLGGIPKSFRNQKIQWLVNSSKEDLYEAKKKLSENIKNSKTAIIFSKPDEKCRKIIDVRL